MLETFAEINMESYVAQQGDPADEEYHKSVEVFVDANVAWRQARKNLDGLRKARGFVPLRKAEQSSRNFQRGRGMFNFKGRKR